LYYEPVLLELSFSWAFNFVKGIIIGPESSQFFSLVIFFF
jgi:hypothetical protein